MRKSIAYVILFFIMLFTFIALPFYWWYWADLILHDEEPIKYIDWLKLSHLEEDEE